MFKIKVLIVKWRVIQLPPFKSPLSVCLRHVFPLFSGCKGGLHGPYKNLVTAQFAWDALTEPRWGQQHVL